MRPPTAILQAWASWTILLVLLPFSILVRASDGVQKSPKAQALEHYKAGLAALGSRSKAHKASIEFEAAIGQDPTFAPAHRQLGQLAIRRADTKAAREYFRKSQDSADPELQATLGAVDDFLRLAVRFENTQDYDECVVAYDRALEVCDQTPAFVRQRAACRQGRGDQAGYLQDMSTYYSLVPIHDPQTLADAVFHYFDLLYQPKMALSAVKSAIAADPENSKVLNQRKLLKDLSSALDQAEQLMSERESGAALQVLEQPIKVSKLSAWSTAKQRTNARDRQNPSYRIGASILMLKTGELLCEAYADLNRLKSAIKVFDVVLEADPDSPACLMVKAKQLIAESNPDEASGLLGRAVDAVNRASLARLGEKIRAVQQECQQAQHMARHRGPPPEKDYYAILDVDRSAGDRDLKRAYRRKSKAFHPDRAKANMLSREEAERKMQDINAAYEILTDPEKRSLFDQGVDPNNPHAMHQQPFRQGPGSFVRMQHDINMDETIRRMQQMAGMKFNFG